MPPMPSSHLYMPCLLYTPSVPSHLHEPSHLAPLPSRHRPLILISHILCRRTPRVCSLDAVAYCTLCISSSPRDALEAVLLHGSDGTCLVLVPCNPIRILSNLQRVLIMSCT
ncbi:hypothetical protein FKP32DRAFT_446262 [Trametes sanguinea]|nr:hypothetical protein FKP32DRAFT_446262 [Trametes sanguinea]